MSTPTTPEPPKPEGYIVGLAHNQPTPVTIVRRTKTTIVVRYLNTPHQMTFNIPKTAGGHYYKRGAGRWDTARLELDTAKVEAQIAQKAAEQTRTNHALHLVNQITHAIEPKFSGYPKRYHGTDADLQKLEAALATLTA
jgi:hypothetical protein